MSHTAEAKTAITRVHEDVLADAIDMIKAQMPDLVLTGTRQPNEAFVTGYGGNRIPVDAAIHTNSIKHGLGLRFRNNPDGLTFIRAEVEDRGLSEMEKLLLMSYQTVACRYAMKSLGYDSQIMGATERGVHVQAVQA